MHCLAGAQRQGLALHRLRAHLRQSIQSWLENTDLSSSNSLYDLSFFSLELITQVWCSCALPLSSRPAMATSPIRLPLSRSPWPSLLRPPSSTFRTCVLSARFLSTSPSSRSSSPAFSYRIAASYSSKEHSLNLSKNLYTHDPFRSAASQAGKLSASERKSKKTQSGHDAFFVSDVAKTGTVAFGVVDGVGGWIDSGIDPSDFSHALCDYMASAAASYPESVPGGATPLRPVELLKVGYNLVAQDKSVYAGGSTACIATASRRGVLEVAK